MRRSSSNSSEGSTAPRVGAPGGRSASPSERLGEGRGSTPTPVRSHGGASIGRRGSPPAARFAARTQPPSEPLPSSASGDKERGPWTAALKCWEVLEATGPLRDALCVALGQPKAACAVGSHPARAAPPAMRPSARDLQRLRRACLAMGDLLAELRPQLGEQPSGARPQAGAPVAPQDRDAHAQTGEAEERVPPTAVIVGDTRCSMESVMELRRRPVPLGSAQNSAVVSDSNHSVASSPDARVAELQGSIGRLSARARELEAPAKQAADLERVVETLRARVLDLESQEGRIEQLRQECSALRLRISELVCTAEQTKEEHKTLLSHLSRLESPLSPGPGMGDSLWS